MERPSYLNIRNVYCILNIQLTVTKLLSFYCHKGILWIDLLVVIEHVCTTMEKNIKASY